MDQNIENQLSPVYQEILNSLVNGQIEQALEQVTAYGWYEFTREVEDEYLFDSYTKLKWLCKLVREDKT